MPFVPRKIWDTDDTRQLDTEALKIECGGRVERTPPVLRVDFETYFADAQAHFRCLDQARNHAFVEARDVTAAYAQMLEVLRE